MPTTQTINKDGLDPDVLAYIEGLESENTDLASALEDATDALEKSHPTNDDDDDDMDTDEVLKGASPEIVELVKRAQAEAEEAKKIAKAERDNRVIGVELTKAADLKFGADTAKLAAAMKDVLDKAAPETYETIWSALNAANEAVKSGNIFKEAGSSGPGADDTLTASQRIDKAARELIEKNADLTYDAAVRQVVASDPTLYNASRKGE